MTTDSEKETNADEPSKDRIIEAVELVHEIVEALTAIGNYVAAAHYVAGAEPGAAPEILGIALRKSQVQLDRAGKAARRLNDLLRVFSRA